MTTINSLASSSNLNLKLMKTDDNNNNEFVRFRATMRLPIPPIWTSNGNSGGNELGSGGMEGVKEVLAGWVMRYLPPLRAVLLTFDPLPTFSHPTSSFPSSSSPFPLPSSRRSNSHLLNSDDDSEDEEEGGEGEGKGEEEVVELKAIPMILGSGFLLAQVEWQGLGWRPRVGQKIIGTPTLSTPSHISLLIHNLFNASIPSSQIPLDQFHFDPEFEVPSSIINRRTNNQLLPRVASASAVPIEVDVAEDDADAEEEEEEEAVELAKEEEKERDLEEELYKEKGWWIHNITKEPLGGGGENCRLEFTILSLTIANSMISLTGSLLPPSQIFSTSNLENLPKPNRSNSVPLRKRPRTQSQIQQEEDDSGESTDDDDEEQGEEREESVPRVRSGGLDIITASASEEESEEEEEEEVEKIEKKKEKKKEKKDSNSSSTTGERKKSKKAKKE